MKTTQFILSLLQEAQVLQLHTTECDFRIYYTPEDGEFRVRLTHPHDGSYDFLFHYLIDERDSRSDMDTLRRIWSRYEEEQVTNHK